MIIQHSMATMETLSSTNLYPHTAKNNSRIPYWHVLQYSHYHYKAQAKVTWRTVITTVKKVEEKHNNICDIDALTTPREKKSYTSAPSQLVFTHSKVLGPTVIYRWINSL